MMVAQMVTIMSTHTTRYSSYTTHPTLWADSSLMPQATLLLVVAASQSTTTHSALRTDSSLMPQTTLLLMVAAFQSTTFRSSLPPMALIVSIKGLGVHGTGTGPSLDSALESTRFDALLAPRVEVALELDGGLAAASWLA